MCWEKSQGTEMSSALTLDFTNSSSVFKEIPKPSIKQLVEKIISHLSACLRRIFFLKLNASNRPLKPLMTEVNIFFYFFLNVLLNFKNVGVTCASIRDKRIVYQDQT